MNDDKPQRIRRTRNELKTAMLDAVMQLAQEKPLSHITMIDVSERSGIRVDVLTRNFTNMERILSMYAASVDYWIEDIFQHAGNRIPTGEEYYKKMYENLVTSLYNDPDMLSLLLWEVTEDNPTTRRIAANREEGYKEAIADYKNAFKDTGLHIDILSAILNAGIYYLILRRKRSTFWGVDFNKRTERKRFFEAVGQYVSMMYDKLREHNRVIEIALRMKENGISDEMIADCTGLPVQAFSAKTD